MEPITYAEKYERIQEIKRRYGEKGSCALLMGVFERAPNITIQEINQMDVLLFCATHESINPLTSGGNCFVVQYRTDEEDRKEEFVSWLTENGYSKLEGKDFDCGWYFVNSDNRCYRGSMHGIKFGNPIGGRFITIDEFKAILEILEKKT